MTSINDFLLPKKTFELNLIFFFRATKNWSKEESIKAIKLIENGLYKNLTFIGSNDLLWKIKNYPYENSLFSKILKSSGDPIKIINQTEISRIRSESLKLLKIQDQKLLKKIYDYVSNNKVSEDILVFLKKNLLTTKKPIYVFRGHDAKEIRSKIDRFFSTTIDPSVAKLFASGNINNVFKIKIPTGTSVIFIDSYEQELLIGPGILKKISTLEYTFSSN
jgi:hypothetical protein